MSLLSVSNLATSVLRMVGSAWNLKTLEIKWRIRPRACKMYERFSLASPSLMSDIEGVLLCLPMGRSSQ